MKEQDILTLTIQGYTSHGLGVARSESRVIFVSGAIQGETVEAKLEKVGRNGVWAKTVRILNPSPHRIEPICPHFGTCGGCVFGHMDYEEELRAKAQRVRDALERIGGLTLAELSIHGAPVIEGYRNKAQYPVAQGRQGRAVVGFYQAKTHRVIPVEHCSIQPDAADKAAKAVAAWMNRYGVSAYHETTGKGLVRHIHIRRGMKKDQTLVCLVINGDQVPQPQALVDLLCRAEPSITAVCLNVNKKPGNVVLGDRFLPLYGPLWVEDTLCGFTFRISPASFYQVNAVQAEWLYTRAAELANLSKQDTVLELYCGIGSITLALSRSAGKVLGVEIVASAVEDAKENARRNGVTNVEFLQGDAGTIAAQLAKRGERPSVLVVDPPRKGLDAAVIQAVQDMVPEKMVYISCDPATLARDLALLSEKGYRLDAAEAVDLFPRTGHVETLVKLSKGLIPHRNIEIEVNLEDLNLADFRGKATYPQIKARVLEQTGMKVSSLNIAQTKRKLGLDVGKNYNVAASEDSKQPPCTPVREKAIREALAYYGVIRPEQAEL